VHFFWGRFDPGAGPQTRIFRGPKRAHPAFNPGRGARIVSGPDSWVEGAYFRLNAVGLAGLLAGRRRGGKSAVLRAYAYTPGRPTKFVPNNRLYKPAAAFSNSTGFRAKYVRPYGCVGANGIPHPERRRSSAFFRQWCTVRQGWENWGGAWGESACGALKRARPKGAISKVPRNPAALGPQGGMLLSVTDRAPRALSAKMGRLFTILFFFILGVEGTTRK